MCVCTEICVIKKDMDFYRFISFLFIKKPFFKRFMDCSQSFGKIIISKSDARSDFYRKTVRGKEICGV